MDVMIDLETMGTGVNSAIVSVGALAFDRYKALPSNASSGMNGLGFYQNVDLQSCLDLGLTIDAATVMFWLKQEEAARMALFTPPPRPVKEVMGALNTFLGRHVNGRSGCVWSHGATFDIPMVSEIMRRLGIKPVWAFWNARDTRTSYDHAGVKLENVNRRAGGHNAFYDCIAQTKLLQESFRIMAGGRVPVAVAAVEVEVMEVLEEADF